MVVRESLTKLLSETGMTNVTLVTIVTLGLLSQQHLEQAKGLTPQVCRIVESDLTDKGPSLIDMKIEIGFVDGEVVGMVIDEVSADAMRVMDGEGNVRLSVQAPR